MMVLPMSTAPQPPAQIARYHEAVTPLGMVALLVDYSHGGQDQYFDGAKLGFFDADGKLGPLRRVTEPGPWNNTLIPLSDEHFLVPGDQSLMRISRVAGPVVGIRFHAILSANCARVRR